MKSKELFQHVTIVEHIFNTTREDYLPKTYDIEVNDESITDIHYDTMLHIYKKLGELLNKEKGGKNEKGV